MLLDMAMRYCCIDPDRQPFTINMFAMKVHRLPASARAWVRAEAEPEAGPEAEPEAEPEPKPVSESAEDGAEAVQAAGTKTGLAQCQFGKSKKWVAVHLELCASRFLAILWLALTTRHCALQDGGRQPHDQKR